MDQKRQALITCAEALHLCRPHVETAIHRSQVKQSEKAEKAMNLLDIALAAASEALSRNDEPEGQK